MAALGLAADAPPALLPALLDALQAAPPGRRTPLIDALASIWTRDAAQALINQTARTDDPDAARRAALLAEGLLDPIDDDPAQRAQRWQAALASLDDRTLQRRFARSIARRLVRNITRLDQTSTLAADTLRRLYFATPARPERQRLLADMLNAMADPARSVALELITREIADGFWPDPPVAAAARALLDDNDPTIRQRVAAMVGAFESEEELLAPRARLAIETDPRVAAELLRSLSRVPTAELRDAALHWARPGSGASAAAAEALAACYAAGLLDTQERRADALAALRSLELTSLPSGALALLVELGLDQDRARVATLLDGVPGVPRVAAARALAGHPAFFERITAAAAADPSLFEAAVTAAVASGPRAGTYRAIAALPARSDTDRALGLQRVASALPLEDLITIAQDATTTPAQRDALLRPLALVGPPPESQPRGPGSEATVAAGLLLLAETNIELRRPAAVLEALDALPPSAARTDRGRLTRLRVIALVMLDQIPAAIAAQAAPSDWVDALELVADQSHAPAVVRTIRQRYARSLSPEETRRLDAIAARIAQAPDPEADPPPDTPPR